MQIVLSLISCPNFGDALGSHRKQGSPIERSVMSCRAPPTPYKMGGGEQGGRSDGEGGGGVLDPWIPLWQCTGISYGDKVDADVGGAPASR